MATARRRQTRLPSEAQVLVNNGRLAPAIGDKELACFDLPTSPERFVDLVWSVTVYRIRPCRLPKVGVHPSASFVLGGRALNYRFVREAESPVGSYEARDASEQACESGHELETADRDDKVVARGCGGAKAPNVVLDYQGMWDLRSGTLQHGGREVDCRDMSLRIYMGEHRGRLPSPCAQVEHVDDAVADAANIFEQHVVWRPGVPRGGLVVDRSECVVVLSGRIRSQVAVR